MAFSGGQRPPADCRDGPVGTHLSGFPIKDACLLLRTQLRGWWARGPVHRVAATTLPSSTRTTTRNALIFIPEPPAVETGCKPRVGRWPQFPTLSRECHSSFPRRTSPGVATADRHATMTLNLPAAAHLREWHPQGDPKAWEGLMEWPQSSHEVPAPRVTPGAHGQAGRGSEHHPPCGNIEAPKHIVLKRQEGSLQQQSVDTPMKRLESYQQPSATRSFCPHSSPTGLLPVLRHTRPACHRAFAYAGLPAQRAAGSSRSHRSLPKCPSSERAPVHSSYNHVACCSHHSVSPPGWVLGRALTPTTVMSRLVYWVWSVPSTRL